MIIQIPETLVPVDTMSPAADAGGRTGVYIPLKYGVKYWLVYYITQGNAATIALTPQQATDTSGTGAKAINAVPIWTNLDSIAGTSFTRQTDAASYTTDAGVKHKIVAFQLSPARALDIANSFYCIAPQTGASNAANITSCMLFIEPDYAGKNANQPSYLS